MNNRSVGSVTRLTLVAAILLLLSGLQAQEDGDAAAGKNGKWAITDYRGLCVAGRDREA